MTREKTIVEPTARKGTPPAAFPRSTCLAVGIVGLDYLIQRALAPGPTFEDGYKILLANFPPHELESKEQLTRFLSDPNFHFNVIYNEDARPIAVRLWRVAPDIGIYATMIAIKPELQTRDGIGASVYDVVLAIMQNEATEIGSVAVIFSEVEVPCSSASDQMRDVVRPKFHDTKSLLRAAEIEYYLPDLSQTCCKPERMLLCFRNLEGALEAVSSKTVAAVVHWLYFDYYHSTYGIPKDDAGKLFSISARQLLGRVPTDHEVSDRSAFIDAVPEVELKLRKISEMVI